MVEQSAPIAVHFGAGNIGRGFIGALLQDAGYFVVYADVNQELIDSLNTPQGYLVTELDGKKRNHHYTNYTALNSVSDQVDLSQWIARAEIVTASVGASILPRIAPSIEAGLALRSSEERLVVMACENALRASEILRDAIQDDQMRDKAVFCNTAVDRIVPLQPAGSEPDVSVEYFSEWVIDTSPLEGRSLRLPGAKQVSNLDPYIERKLYTVNTAHLAAAYLGELAGHHTIVAALNDPKVRAGTEAALAETSKVLVLKHGLKEKEHAKYVAKTLERISNPAVDDEVARVGRDPMRKLSRNERLIGPAAYYAEHVGRPEGLLAVIDAALSFGCSEDHSTQELRAKLGTMSVAEFAESVFGIGTGDALAPMLEEIINSHKVALALDR